MQVTIYEVKTPAIHAQINKATGAIAKLYSQPAKWSVFGDASDGNALQLLGDSGNAWELHYTGTNQTLATEHASVFDRRMTARFCPRAGGTRGGQIILHAGP